MSSSPLTFPDLPTELKCRIMQGLDVRSLLRLSLTSKSINEVIYASKELVLEIEMGKSGLIYAMNTRSTPMARKLIEAHMDARLNLPVATRPCVMFPAPEDGVCIERLFRGLLACITEDDMLHIWNLRHPDPTRLPPKILLASEGLIDVVIEPAFNLLVLLCKPPGRNRATIKLLDYGSGGRQPHPGVASAFITHTPLPTDRIEYYHGQQLLTLRGDLLAFTYNRHADVHSRRGIIWAWKTGVVIYDSMDFVSSTDFHDLLLLPSTPNFFLVTVSTFLVVNPTAPLGAWIELRHCDLITTTTSQLVAEFCLPEFEDPEENCLGAMEFSSSEPPNGQLENDNIFPFISKPATSVYVLYIWYKTRPEVTPAFENRVYLIISNMAFSHVLAMWSRRDDPSIGISFPIRKGWIEWAPWWTATWSYDDLGVLSGTSSVCGNRILSVGHPEKGVIELLILDFNMNIPCSQWNCTDPLAHFYPQSYKPEVSFWTTMVCTWLPFHTLRKRFTIQREDDEHVMCTSVFMDEERIVFSTCPNLDDVDMDLVPTGWKVVHLIGEPTALGSNCFMPVVEEEMKSTQVQHDQICRMCKERPHTDTHILLECMANHAVVDLRRTYLPYIGVRDRTLRTFHEVFQEFMARRDMTLMPVSMLAKEIHRVYRVLPRCSELVLADKEDSASIMFLPKE